MIVLKIVSPMPLCKQMRHFHDEKTKYFFQMLIFFNFIFLYFLLIHIFFLTLLYVQVLYFLKNVFGFNYLLEA